MSTLMETAEKAIEAIMKEGADEAAVALGRSRGVDIEWRDGQLERVQEQTRQSLSVEVFVDGRYSASSTSDLRQSALERFLCDAVSMTRLLEIDPHRGLPASDSYGERVDVDLDLCDNSQMAVTSEERLACAANIEAQIRAEAGSLPIASVASGVSDGYGQTARVHSNGFQGFREGTTFSRSAMVTVMDGDGKRPMGWDYTYRRHQADLDPLEKVADRARIRAGLLLGAKPPKTGRYNVVIANRAVPKMLSALLSPISGPALQQRRSLWEGRINTQIAGSLLTIHDDPHKVRGIASSLWDGDGFATVKRPLIKEGVLQTYLIDQYYARKMETAPTGGETHNLEWILGNKDADALIAAAGDGIYIDRFLGGNSNQTTGELSFGCGGRIIQNGKLGASFTEGNLSGNLSEIWMQLAALGNDPDPNSSSGCPTCLFENIQISGR